jgi:hypothetical protein
MKKLAVIVLKIGIVLLFLVGILFIASKYVEQKIVEKAISAINKQLDVPVFVEKISFSLYKKFPQATLQLNNVLLRSSGEFNQNHFSETYTDTLVFFKELYLSINVMSLREDRLDITKAYAQNGQINILTDKKGNQNYNILSERIEKKASEEVHKDLLFLLNQIQLKRISIRFVNKYKGTAVSIYAPEYTVKGQFYKDEYAASSSGKLLLNYFEHGQIKINPDNPANITMNLNVTNEAIKIVESSIDSKDFHFNAKGKVGLIEPINLDLQIVGNTNNLDGFIGMVDNIKSKKVITQGQLAVSTRIIGIIDAKRSPAVAVNFKLNNGGLSLPEQHINFHNIQLNGSYSNGDKRNATSSQLVFETFSIAMQNSSLSGNLSIQNFNKPLITLSANTAIQCIDFDRWVVNKTNYLFDGKVEGDIYCKGYLDSSENYTLSNFQHWEKLASLQVTDGMFRMGSPSFSMEDLSTEIQIQTNKITFNNLSAKVQTSNVKGNAFIFNYYEMLVDSTQPLNINATLIADQISYANFKHLFEKKNNDNEGRGINLYGNFEVKKFYYEKLIAEKVSGKLEYENEQTRIDNLQFNTMEGKVMGKVNYIPKSENRYLFQTHTTTHNVNIKELFATFNNFEQTFIKDENLEGYITSNFDLEMDFVNGKMESSSIELLGHARIDNGKLINFEPIKQVSKFSEIKELEHIEFSKLENDILISKSTVTIPKMELSSNAFDISLFGKQQFSGDYEYHISLYLTDFIGGKSKRLAKQQSEFGYIEDDGLGSYTLYLLATSKNGESKVKLDGDAIKGSIKEDVKKEKKEFKKALHDEFGWFKKDTTLREPEIKKKKPEFKIEWDEE